jgi:pyruvate formate lyase activating enzyme
LPEVAPPVGEGVACKLCAQECRIPEGQVGYCGLPAGGRHRAKVSWYYDALPTNCVAAFVCPAGTGCGYPRFARCPGPERGFKNLAVFYETCSLNCLFCQNWTYRQSARRNPTVSAQQLAEAVDAKTACICFFGGDPTPQLPHSLEAARLALARRPGEVLRVCWETCGNMHPKLLDQMADLALATGGCIKFDLKVWHESVHMTLTGASNQRSLENFRRVARRVHERPEVPLLVASTLLVPGYVDAEEVGRLARFIAGLDRGIPYSLLAFHPDFLMDDLPVTSRAQLQRCYQAAQEGGLTRLHVGNWHLLAGTEH